MDVGPTRAVAGDVLLAVNATARGVGGIAKPLGLLERISRIHQDLDPVGRRIGPSGTVGPRINDARLSAVVYRRLVPFDDVGLRPFDGRGFLLRHGGAWEPDGYHCHCGRDQIVLHCRLLFHAMTSVIGRAVFIQPEPYSPTGAPTSCCAVREARVTESPVVWMC